MTDRQTDRKQYIGAHHAIFTGGLKKVKSCKSTQKNIIMYKRTPFSYGKRNLFISIIILQTKILHAHCLSDVTKRARIICVHTQRLPELRKPHPNMITWHAFWLQASYVNNFYLRNFLIPLQNLPESHKRQSCGFVIFNSRCYNIPPSESGYNRALILTLIRIYM